MRNPIPDIVKDELEACGLPYELIVGGRHYKLVVGGRLAGILPRGAKAILSDSHRRDQLNMRAQVRRIIKELKSDRQA